MIENPKGNQQYIYECQIRRRKERRKKTGREFNFTSQELTRSCDKAIENMKENMSKGVRHWNIKMGEEKLQEMFPDLDQRRKG